MLGLITAGGAVALEIRRALRKGSAEEAREAKANERQLRALLEATTKELDKLKDSSEAAEARAAQLEQTRAKLEADVQTLQQNNTKLVLTNVMLLNSSKQLEENARDLVAKNEHLQHQNEALQRDRAAELADLKDQVSCVLNRYLSKDLDLQAALEEMAAMGIELVPIDTATGATPNNVTEFETKLVLDSPQLMQRLMSAAAGRALQLPSSSEQDVPMLSFPMGINKDPATGMPRISLGWRHGGQFGALPGSISGGGADAEQQAQDQQGARPALQDKASAGAAAAGGEALSSSGSTSSSTAPKQVKQKSGGGFSLGWGSSKASSSSSAKKQPVVVPSIKGGFNDSIGVGGMDDDDMPGNSLMLRK